MKDVLFYFKFLFLEENGKFKNLYILTLLLRTTDS